MFVWLKAYCGTPLWQGAWALSGELSAAPPQEVQLAVLQQRLGHKAEAAETEELREQLAALRGDVKRLQAGMREGMSMAAADEPGLAAAIAPRRSVLHSQSSSALRKFSQITSPLFAPSEPVPDSSEPSAQPLPDQVPPVQPDQALGLPADVPAPTTLWDSLEEADAALGPLTLQADAEGGGSAPGSSPRASVISEQQPEPEPDEAVQPAGQTLPAGAAEVLHLGVQQALQELEDRLEGLQDDVDSMSLQRDADGQLIATLEAQMLGAQKLGLLPPDTALKAAGLLDDMDLESAKADLIPAYLGDAKRAGDAPAEQSMRTVRKALSVITNASYIMSVGESLPMLDQVRTRACPQALTNHALSAFRIPGCIAITETALTSFATRLR